MTSNTFSKSKRKESLVRTGAAGTAAISFWINLYCQGYNPGLDCEKDKWKKQICMYNVDDPPKKVQETHGEVYPSWGRNAISYSTSTATVSGTTTTTTL